MNLHDHTEFYKCTKLCFINTMTNGREALYAEWKSTSFTRACSKTAATVIASYFN